MNQEKVGQDSKTNGQHYQSKENASDETQSLEAARRLRPLVITTSVISIVSSLFFFASVLSNTGSPDSQYYLFGTALLLAIYCFLGVPLVVLILGILTIVKSTKIRPPYNSLAISSRIGAIVLLLEPLVTVLGIFSLYAEPLLMMVLTGIALIVSLILSIWSLAFFCSRLSEALRVYGYDLSSDNGLRPENIQQYNIAVSTYAPTVQSNRPLEQGKSEKKSGFAQIITDIVFWVYIVCVLINLIVVSQEIIQKGYVSSKNPYLLVASIPVSAGITGLFVSCQHPRRVLYITVTWIAALLIMATWLMI